MSGIVGNNTNRSSGLVKAAAVGADAITGSEIADDSIDSEHYVDGSIDNAHIADDAIDSEHYADGSIDNAHIADDAIDSEHYAAGSIDEAHLSADCVTGAKIADDAIDSEHYTDASIDAAHIASNAVTTAKINADAVTGAKIADDTLNSEHYAAGSVDLEHMSSESVDEDNLHISNAGSNGQFLSKQSGNSGGLTWASAGGAWTKITKTTASTSSTVAFTSGITDAYNTFAILISGTYTSGDAQILLDFSNDGGSSYEGGGVYEWSNRIWEADGGTNDAQSTSGDAFQIAMNSTTDGNGSVTAQADSHYIYISRAATASQYTNASWWGIYMSTGNSPTTYFGGGVYHTGEAINAFRLSTSTSATFVKGDFTLFGIEA